MRVLVDIIHPAHVHFFRNAIIQWRSKGHDVAITSRQKDVTESLLENYGLEHVCLSKSAKGLGGLFIELISRDIKLLEFCRKFKPDVLTGISGMFVSHIGKLIGKPAIVFDDTEHQRKAHLITWPLATQVHSPDCYLKKAVTKQRLYNGFHELAYLAPKYFTPDKEVVRSLGIEPDERYCILRLVSWQAHHDVGQHGFAGDNMITILKKISDYARAYLCVEGQCPEELRQYQLTIPVHQIHHVLAFSSLVAGEGATMISEAAVLGVPAVYINTLKLGYINMLEQYGLVKQTIDSDEALEYSLDLLRDDNSLKRCQEAKEKMLADKIDMTEYIVQTVEQAGARQ
ncbi:MAG TPA: DUF354 domain-containing protein [Phycisphaerales bacterium]|nr:DUF354 domain-containing protein [Phycisphaerales bacterium]